MTSCTRDLYMSLKEVGLEGGGAWGRQGLKEVVFEGGGAWRKQGLKEVGLEGGGGGVRGEAELWGRQGLEGGGVWRRWGLKDVGLEGGGAWGRHSLVPRPSNATFWRPGHEARGRQGLRGVSFERGTSSDSEGVSDLFPLAGAEGWWQQSLSCSSWRKTSLPEVTYNVIPTNYDPCHMTRHPNRVNSNPQHIRTNSHPHTQHVTVCVSQQCPPTPNTTPRQLCSGWVE